MQTGQVAKRIRAGTQPAADRRRPPVLIANSAIRPARRGGIHHNSRKISHIKFPNCELFGPFSAAFSPKNRPVPATLPRENLIANSAIRNRANSLRINDIKSSNRELFVYFHHPLRITLQTANRQSRRTFLIANHAIRTAPKPRRLNKVSISNREETPTGTPRHS